MDAQSGRQRAVSVEIIKDTHLREALACNIPSLPRWGC